jgi:hypothetical protein
MAALKTIPEAALKAISEGDFKATVRALGARTIFFGHTARGTVVIAESGNDVLRFVCSL